MELIENKTFDAERALYGSDGISIKNCRFDGPADGESALKASRNIVADSCFFNLRYPFWHDHDLTISSSEMTEPVSYTHLDVYKRQEYPCKSPRQGSGAACVCCHDGSGHDHGT